MATSSDLCSSDKPSDKPYIFISKKLEAYSTIFEKYFVCVGEEDDMDQYRDKITAIAKFEVPKELLDSLPFVKVVATASAGYNYIDLETCKSRGIKVGNAPNAYNEPTADMGMALLLAVAKRVVEGDKRSRNPDIRSIVFNWYGSQVSGSTAGIIGLGRIGQEVAKRMRGFDMKILYYGRSRKPQEIEALTNAQYVPDLYDMLSQSDFVILVAPATKETYHMMSSKEFKSMKSTGIFINISRGELVDQEALVEALTNGEIKGAGLDVTDPEPLPIGHPLLSFDNVVITPHAAGNIYANQKKACEMVIANILAGLNGEKLPYEVIMN